MRYQDIIQEPRQGKLHITLTYAQSLDGFIGKVGSQLVLSGPEANRLTHTIRNRRDAILVGIGTILNEDPRLTTRLDDEPRINNPVPVIVDSQLRTPIQAKAIQTRIAIGIKPIIICGIDASNQELESLVHIIRVPALEGARLDLALGISKLSEFGIKSLMIEGGASIIKDILSNRLEIDELIITIAPRLIMNGVHSTLDITKSINQPDIKNPKWHILGSDCILTGYISKID